MAFKIRLSSFKILIEAVFSLIFFASCEKLVDVDPPPNQVSSANVYNSDITAIAVLDGLYTNLSVNYYGGTASIPTISMWAGLSADEFTLWTTGSGADLGQLAYYENSLSSINTGSEFWANIYPYIYACNGAIQGLTSSSSISPAVKQQLLGESKFMRAFFYFYLTNLFGDVPLVLSTDYTINASLPRTSRVAVYQQIITDLKDAQQLLVEGYVKADAKSLYDPFSAERVRPNKAAATALLARTYLYVGDYVNSEIQSSSVINNTTYYSLPDLNSVFLKNSPEAIWQLQPVNSGDITNTADAVEFILSYAPAGLGFYHPVFLSNSLLASFESGDLRNVNGNWVNTFTDATGTYYYPYKYKDASLGTGVIPTEYTMILRLGEQYLIRAEAEANGAQGGLGGAVVDLNSIRTRAGLPPYAGNLDQASILGAIYHERQVELFTEMGHRWLDLKRTGSVDAVMSVQTPLKGGSWRPNQALYPIPQTEILLDGGLTQNPGY